MAQEFVQLLEASKNSALEWMINAVASVAPEKHLSLRGEQGESIALSAAISLVGTNFVLLDELAKVLKSSHGGRVPQTQAHVLSDAWSRNISCERLCHDAQATDGKIGLSLVADIWPVALTNFYEMVKIGTGVGSVQKLVERGTAIIGVAQAKGQIDKIEEEQRKALAAAN